MHRPMVGSPQMPHMDEHIARRLWRSSMDRSEVAAWWPAISICTSIGSAVSDVGCHLATRIVGVDGGMASRRAGEVQRCDVHLLRSFLMKFNLIDWGGVIVTNLFLGYLKSIVGPRSALCHLILDVGRDLDGVAHNIAVGYGMFIRVKRTPNWWPLWRLRFHCFWTFWVRCQAKQREIRALGTQRCQANGRHWMDTLGTQRGESTGNMCLGKSTLPCESSPSLRIRRGCGLLLSPL